MPSFTLDETAKLLKTEEDEVLMTNTICQMMFVSGETVEPSPETSMLVEQIVQQQVMEMVSRLAPPYSEPRLTARPAARLYCLVYAPR
jgi:hypothetical protein